MKIVSFFLKYWRQMGLRNGTGIFILVTLVSIVNGVAHAALLSIINKLLAGEATLTQATTLTFIALCVVVPLSMFLSENLLMYLGTKTVFQLHADFCRRIFAAPLRSLEELGSHKILAVLGDDVRNISNALLGLMMLIMHLTVLLGTLGYLFTLSWQLFLLVVFVLALGLISYELFAAQAFKHLVKARRHYDGLFKSMTALSQGNKELKLHGTRRIAFFNDMFQPSASGYRDHTYTGNMYYSAAGAWANALYFLLIGTIVYIIPQVQEPNLKVLTGVTLVVLYMMTPILSLLGAMSVLAIGEVSINKINDLGIALANNARERMPEDDVANSITTPTPRLELKEVSHTYYNMDQEKSFTLGPLTTAFEPGTVTFMIGGNGSGKTTLAKLIAGLYTPEQGSLLVDGQPIDDENRDDFRQLFSTVFLDFYLFDQLLGFEGRNIDARAQDYLEKLELDHKVTIEDGRLSTLDLSQGQRKRLALLTAYLEDRPIYLFDEWASDQDPIFREIFYTQILPDLKQRGKIVLAITHDDRFMHLADRIIKLNYGQVEADGPPDSLAGFRPEEVDPHQWVVNHTRPLQAPDADPEPVTPAPASPAPEHRSPILGWCSAAVLAGLLFLGLGFETVPDPVPATAPADVFSAERALTHLNTIASEMHPVGTPAHARVLHYLENQVQAMGFQSERLTADVYNNLPYLNHLAPISNLLVHLPGSDSSGTLLVMGHYDSGFQSYGANDDGVAVAAMLETLRALKDAGPFQNDVVFLFSDGEELGLMGARHYAATHPTAKDVALVLNFEARGSSGPSMMFETGPNNAGVIAEFARAVPVPTATSMGYEVYRHMPNDTDYTVFKEKGVAGLNFAFIEDANHYHTNIDSLANVNQPQIQHHGDQMLALVRHFGDLDMADINVDADRVYFNIMGGFVHYAGGWSLPLLLLATLVFAAMLFEMKRNGDLTFKPYLTAFAAFGGTMVLVLFAATLLWLFIQTSHPGYALMPSGQPYNVSIYFWTFLAFTAAIAGPLINRSMRFNGSHNTMAGILTWWLIFSVPTTLFAPGAGYLFVWPLLFLAGGELFRTQFRDQVFSFVAAGLALVPVFLLTLSAVQMLFIAIPTIGVGLIAFLLCLCLGAAGRHIHLLRGIHRRFYQWGLPLLTTTLLIAGYITATPSEKEPLPTSLIYINDLSEGKALWASTLPQPDAWSAQYIDSPREMWGDRYVPYDIRSLIVDDAPVVATGAAEIEVLADHVADGQRMLSLNVKPRAGVVFTVIALSKEPEAKAGWVNGEAMGSTRNAVVVHGARAAIHLKLALAPDQPLSMRVTDVTRGRPEALQVTPRPDHTMSDGVWEWYQDSTLVSRDFDLSQSFTVESASAVDQPE